MNVFVFYMDMTKYCEHLRPMPFQFSRDKYTEVFFTTWKRDEQEIVVRRLSKM